MEKFTGAAAKFFDKDLGCDFIVAASNRSRLRLILKKWTSLPVPITSVVQKPNRVHAPVTFTMPAFAVQEGWENEKQMLECLARVHGYARAIARCLGVTDSLIVQKCKKHGIQMEKMNGKCGGAKVRWERYRAAKALEEAKKDEEMG